MNKIKITYWISSLIACGIMAYSASMYFMNTDMIKGYFEMLHYPSYVVIPLAIAKILGIIAILSRKINFLKEWAYAGFLFDGILAFTAHIEAGDGGYLFSLIVIITTLVSYFTEKHAFKG